MFGCLQSAENWDFFVGGAMITNRMAALVSLGLPEIESKTLLQRTKTCSFPRKTIVLEKGNRCDALYLVLEGRAKAVEIDSCGNEQVLSYYDPGNHFGWTGLENGLLVTSIMTEEPSRFLVLPKNDFISLLFENDSLRERVTENHVRAAQKSRELSEAIQHKTAISEILRTISRSPSDIQSILDTVAEYAWRLCDVNDVAIFQVEGDGLRLVAKYGEGLHLSLGTLIPLDRGWVTGRAVIDRCPIHVDDLLAEKAEFPLSTALAELYGYRTAFAVPMLRGEGAIGAILIRRREVWPLPETQRELLQTFADEAAIAIDKVRLFNDLHEKNRKVEEQVRSFAEWRMELKNSFTEQAKNLTKWNAELETLVGEHEVQLEVLTKLEHDLSVAGKIQNSMLPRFIPSLTGYEFSAVMLPARYVGGDFFDFIPLGENLLGIAVGDVSGKGVPAALFMAMVRSLLRAEAHRGRSAQKVLRSVNRHLMDMNDEAMFATVVFGILNALTRQFEYVRAGHELPIFIDELGSVMQLQKTSGQPLGLFEDLVLDENIVELSKGRRLLLCSDGIVDAVNRQNVRFGYDGIVRAVEQTMKSSASTVCGALIEAVKSHQIGLPQFDDMTVVVMKAI
jgi:serine phosphatase RsbU (regulator of sigma subunit)/CRP-like cAMP-binding protein